MFFLFFSAFITKKVVLGEIKYRFFSGLAII